MSSSTYNCVNASHVAVLKKAAVAYRKMADRKVIVGAACTAGELLRQRMESLVHGESSLSSYKDVAGGFKVWADGKNVYVGLPKGDPLESRAEKMDQSYQVNEVILDLAKQSGEIEEKFLAELAAVVS